MEDMVAYAKEQIRAAIRQRKLANMVLITKAREEARELSLRQGAITALDVRERLILKGVLEPGSRLFWMHAVFAGPQWGRGNVVEQRDDRYHTVRKYQQYVYLQPKVSA